MKGAERVEQKDEPEDDPDDLERLAFDEHAHDVKDDVKDETGDDEGEEHGEGMVRR